MSVDANEASEMLALRIMTQRLFALIASTQPDPDGFVLKQLESAKADVDRYGLINDRLEDQKLIRNETKSILTTLYHGMLQKPSKSP